MGKKNLNIKIAIEDVNRLDVIRVKHGFTDTNQIIEYLVHCFLRVADPANDPIDEPIPQEIEDMFLLPIQYKDRERSFLRIIAGMSKQIKYLIKIIEIQKKLCCIKVGL